MTQQEKKKYILKVWDISSGKRISEKLKRYYSGLPKENSGVDIIKTAQEVFVGTKLI